MDVGEVYNKQTIGRLSGYILVFLFVVLVPFLMFSDPNFNFNLTSFSPVSNLGTTSESHLYFDTIFITSGILALLYFNFYYFDSRELFHLLPFWKFAKIIINTGAVSTSALGIFNKNQHPEHMLAVLFMVAGFIGYIILITIDISDYYDYRNSPFSKLVFFGYFTAIAALMYTFYFRFTNIHGLYTVIVITNIFIWYFWELMVYNDFITWVNNQDKLEPSINRLNWIIYFIIVIVIWLLINSYIIINKIDFNYISCSTTNSRCTSSNAILMIFAALILFLGSFNLVIRDRKKQRGLN